MHKCLQAVGVVVDADNNGGVSTPLKEINIGGSTFMPDACFNIPPRILGLIGRSLHNQPCHPLCMMKSRIVDFLAKVR